MTSSMRAHWRVGDSPSNDLATNVLLTNDTPRMVVVERAQIVSSPLYPPTYLPISSSHQRSSLLAGLQ